MFWLFDRFVDQSSFPLRSSATISKCPFTANILSLPTATPAGPAMSRSFFVTHSCLPVLLSTA